MERCFVSRNTECPGGCKYCFSKWNNYIKFETPAKINNNAIVYPNCDGDMFDNHFEKLMSDLRKLVDKDISISVSTKFNIRDDYLNELSGLNKTLLENGRGIVKISVSFSCVSAIGEIEKNTASYKERLDLIRRITQLNIPYVTIIKPILPFVDEGDYIQIINDTIEFSPYYLIGDLYVSTDSSFYSEYIKNKYVTEIREVPWNGENGPWPVVVDDEKRQHIREYILSKGGVVFDTDIEVIEYLKQVMLKGVDTNE